MKILNTLCLALLLTLILGSLSVFTVQADLLGLSTGWSPTAGHLPDPSGLANLRFEHLTVEDGLSQNAVLAILQDSQGFLWLGTEGGLNRYDGYNFTIFKHDPEDSGSLSDNFISWLYEDRQGELWIGTRSGLNRFDWDTGSFILYQNSPDDPKSLGGKWVVAMLEDSTGIFWVGTDDGGLDQFDRATNTFTHFRHDPENLGSLSSDTVRQVYEDHDGQIWVGTTAGLDRFDRKSGTFSHYQHNAGDPQSLSDDAVTVIFEDSQRYLWVGTETAGLNRFDPASQTFTHYLNDPYNSQSLSHNRVRSILEDSSGRLWIGTQNGLDQLVRQQPGDASPNEEHFVHYKHDLTDPFSLSADTIWSMYEDRGGVIWFGTYGGGLDKLTPSSNRFALYHHTLNPNSLSDDMVWTIYEDRQGILWIGTFNGGLNRLDRKAGKFTVFQHLPEDFRSLSSNDVRAVLEDHDGVLWVGTSGGLDRFEASTKTFTHFRRGDDPNSLADNRVTVLLEDHEGNLWVGTRSGGVNRLDKNAGTFQRYQHDSTKPASLSDNRVWSLYEDSSGILWIGTLGGVDLLDPTSNQITHLKHDPQNPQTLSNDAVFSFHEDQDGAMWIGTWGSGLDRFDRATRTFTHFTEKDGLPDNVIYGLLADAQGRLWLSTNKGISCFYPRMGTFRNYDVRDGLQNNEFNVGAHYKSQDGEMFFGGVGGFNAFFPDQLQDNSHLPTLVITAFSKFNRVVQTTLAPDEHIRLGHNDNFISFEFAALDFSVPEKNQYAYQMEGLDKDWVKAGTRRHADYPNLRPGNYTFRVRGSNNDGVWNEAGIAIPITVTPPFWGTWWFRSILGIFLVGGAVGVYRWRVKSIEAHSLALEEQVRQRTHEIQLRTQELEALYRADEELHRHLQLDQVLQTLMKLAVDMLSADKSSLMVWDRAQERFFMRYSHGLSATAMSQMSVEKGQGVVGQAAARGEVMIVEDTQREPRRAYEQAWLTELADAEGIRSFMNIPIKVHGEVFGIFSVIFTEPHTFTQQEQRLYTALVQRASLAIENAQLYGQAQALATLEERQRLARDLHDAVTQTLFSASLIAEVLPDLWNKDPQEGQQLLKELRHLSRGALAEMRTLLLELRPAALMEANLPDLLRQLAEAASGRTGIPILVHREGECNLAPDLQVALYRIAQEAINNVVKHAHAHQAEISLHCSVAQQEDGQVQQSVELSILDDGLGFDPANIPPDHLGLGIMYERARATGVDLKIESQPGQGTRVTAVWKEQDL